MSESIEWPPPLLGRPRRRRRFLLVLVGLAVIFFGGRAVLSYFVDVLWFRSLGYEDVFWKTLNLQGEIFAAFAAATFLILYGSFLALKRAHLPDLPEGHPTRRYEHDPAPARRHRPRWGCAASPARDSPPPPRCPPPVGR